MGLVSVHDCCFGCPDSKKRNYIEGVDELVHVRDVVLHTGGTSNALRETDSRTFAVSGSMLLFNDRVVRAPESKTCPRGGPIRSLSFGVSPARGSIRFGQEGRRFLPISLPPLADIHIDAF